MPWLRRTLCPDGLSIHALYEVTWNGTGGRLQQGGVGKHNRTTEKHSTPRKMQTQQRGILFLFFSVSLPLFRSVPYPRLHFVHLGRIFEAEETQLFIGQLLEKMERLVKKTKQSPRFPSNGPTANPLINPLCFTADVNLHN
jgi:hypothetical protein